MRACDRTCLGGPVHLAARITRALLQRLQPPGPIAERR
jgi:hypothetical protein